MKDPFSKKALERDLKRKARNYRRRFKRQERQYLSGHNSRFTLQGRKSLA